MENSLHFDEVHAKLREFFREKKGFIEVPSQARCSILAACEDPKTITSYGLQDTIYPLPQTGQMWLEYELLNNPDVPGFFCSTTSYRDEPNVIEGRHRRIFPLFEFEAKGDLNDLKKLEKDLLKFLGLDEPVEIEYEHGCEELSVDTIEAKEEEILTLRYGDSLFLQNFPQRSHPFWNMKRDPQGHFRKVDVILGGMETIGSAERETDKDEMRRQFLLLADGAYAQTLFDKFTKERVMKEMDEYLSFDMFKRFGGGIGVTRLIAAMEKKNLLSSTIRPFQTSYKQNDIYIQ